VQGAVDEAPTTSIGGRTPSGSAARADERGSGRGRDRDAGRPPERGRGAGRSAGDEDEDLEYDEELERFASGDEDASPFARGGAEPTHRDRPGDIPYDLEQDDPGTDEPPGDRRSSKGSTWRSGPFRGR
jgi:hypothetical protein